MFIVRKKSESFISESIGIHLFLQPILCPEHDTTESTLIVSVGLEIARDKIHNRKIMFSIRGKFSH